MSPPIFTILIAIVHPWRNIDGTQDSISKLRGTSSLLSPVKNYVGENIKKMISLILEAWELVNSYVSLGSKLTNLRQYLHVVLENDEGFYKEVVITFVLKVFCMSELKIKEE
jgi:hypothetical protein